MLDVGSGRDGGGREERCSGVGERGDEDEDGDW